MGTERKVIKIAVIGSRAWSDRDKVWDTLDDYRWEQYRDNDITSVEIISGGAKGADDYGWEYATVHLIPITIIKPDYATYGKAAPLIRNKIIIDPADIIFAFWDGKSKGTLHAITYASKSRKRVFVIKS